MRDGEPLPGSSSDPQTRYKNAYLIVYFIAGLNLLLGVLASLFNVALLQQLGIGFGSILLGFVYLLLGFFVQKKSALNPQGVVPAQSPQGVVPAQSLQGVVPAQSLQGVVPNLECGLSMHRAHKAW